MANQKISDLTAATIPLAGSELVEVVQSGTNKKAAVSDIGGTGGGDVHGPASSTDNTWPRFDGTGGKTIQTGTWSEADSTGAVTAGGDLDMVDKVLQRPELKDYAETSTSPSVTSGTLTFDLEASNVFDVTLGANVTTLTISNPPASGKAGSFSLILRQDATGSRTVAWGGIKWPGGLAPTISTAGNAVDILSFLTTDAGTTWWGFLAGKGMA